MFKYFIIKKNLQCDLINIELKLNHKKISVKEKNKLLQEKNNIIEILKYMKGV